MLAASARHDALDHLWIHESPRVRPLRPRHAPRLRRGRGRLAHGRSRRPLLRSVLVDVAGAARSRPRGHRRGLCGTGARVACAGPIYFTTEGAIELAERLAAACARRPDQVLLTSSGSEATETAIKLARQYHRTAQATTIASSSSPATARITVREWAAPRFRASAQDALYYPLMPGTVNVMPPTGTNDIEAAEAIGPRSRWRARTRSRP